MLRICRTILSCPRIWATAWITWFAVLWFLSSGTPEMEKLPPIPHMDKVMHFGYFFGGAGLLYIPIHHRFTKHPRFFKIGLCTLAGLAVGVVDEFHQSFVPGRFGNDPGDLLADGLGSLMGAIVMARIIKALLPSVTA